MKICSPETAPQLVGIVGGSGAGKSWLAAQLQRRLGTNAVVLCQDSFYLDRSQLPLGRRALLNFDQPRAVDWQCLEQVLLDCKRGQSVQVPRYDFVTHTRAAGVDRVGPAGVILVEGLWLLRRAALRRLFDLSIFIQCSPAVQLERRIRRDTAERGRKESVVRQQFMDVVVPMAARYVAPQARWAARIVQSPVTEDWIDEFAGELRQRLGHRFSRGSTSSRVEEARVQAP